MATFQGVKPEGVANKPRLIPAHSNPFRGYKNDLHEIIRESKNAHLSQKFTLMNGIAEAIQHGDLRNGSPRHAIGWLLRRAEKGKKEDLAPAFAALTAVAVCTPEHRGFIYARISHILDNGASRATKEEARLAKGEIERYLRADFGESVRHFGNEARI